jgi:hypothetical protein
MFKIKFAFLVGAIFIASLNPAFASMYTLQITNNITPGVLSKLVLSSNSGATQQAIPAGVSRFVVDSTVHYDIKSDTQIFASLADEPSYYAIQATAPDHSGQDIEVYIETTQELTHKGYYCTATHVISAAQDCPSNAETLVNHTDTYNKDGTPYVPTYRQTCHADSTNAVTCEMGGTSLSHTPSDIYLTLSGGVLPTPKPTLTIINKSSRALSFQSDVADTIAPGTSKMYILSNSSYTLSHIFPNGTTRTVGGITATSAGNYTLSAKNTAKQTPPLYMIINDTLDGGVAGSYYTDEPANSQGNCSESADANDDSVSCVLGNKNTTITISDDPQAPTIPENYTYDSGVYDLTKSYAPEYNNPTQYPEVSQTINGVTSHYVACWSTKGEDPSLPTSNVWKLYDRYYKVCG